MYQTQALHRALQQYGDRVAVRFAGRERTFAAFAERVARLAGALQQLGLQDGDRIAILALNSDRYLEFQMAVPWAGGAVNPCNIRWSAAELLYALDDSGTTMLLVDDTFAALGAQLRRDAQTVRELIYCGDGPAPEGMRDYEALLADAAAVTDRYRRGEDLAGIFYTGGTTGFAKGVMLSHSNLGVAALTALAAGLARPGAVYLHAAPMFHIADIGLAGPHWVEGNTHVILPAFEPKAVLEAIERHGVTHTVLVPTMIQRLVEQAEGTSRYDVTTLETVSYGASPMSPALLARAQAVFPNARFRQLYGMTEAGPVAIESASPSAAEREGAAGRPCYCVQVKVVNAQGVEVPRHTPGEVALCGPNVMQGYWNKPEQTAAVLRGGWYFTGDGGYMDEDGFLHVVDRIKDMIITGGENVYSAEVESVIAAHPAVAASAVIAVPDARWGEAVHAVVVAVPGASVSAQDIIAHCKTRIAGYKCPRSVEFVDELPVSGAGKVLKIRLRERYWKDRARSVA
ncbi:long-chain-fatty-acid--CoA ligase [Paraburkholderia silviterrae]|uniref:Long-chain-fatty-acid--CoA ligase n=1 Tax=Paraburkholderia silviterrae TaxID=2528715 RepID=A0A4R5M7A7_9BURK|nr:long-chain-fatty-acid--CoA ligase [Paraburkholderia silviterrae]TDG21557.1 long-chain-fatty-acid--CoA ligase [Paraburkholderia silviterrae]